jgi:hypothetical protein
MFEHYPTIYLILLMKMLLHVHVYHPLKISEYRNNFVLFHLLIGLA